jgi:hypothetical protein
MMHRFIVQALHAGSTVLWQHLIYVLDEFSNFEITVPKWMEAWCLSCRVTILTSSLHRAPFLKGYGGIAGGEAGASDGGAGAGGEGGGGGADGARLHPRAAAPGGAGRPRVLHVDGERLVLPCGQTKLSASGLLSRPHRCSYTGRSTEGKRNCKLIAVGL